jgi:hypothetical protein
MSAAAIASFLENNPTDALIKEFDALDAICDEVLELNGENVVDWMVAIEVDLGNRARHDIVALFWAENRSALPTEFTINGKDVTI